ncbi:hypothetical protein AVEN_177081-1 [Araneus ventricosus]|uniref:Uncharacterized protein n=1 Tax=Araneus ventricosus TaxID=182803 RepID=A0A4Y2CTK1_ARAVE|nr:hypothetical protein AVEN_177081-1 [Araneus ventricosus]
MYCIITSFKRKFESKNILLDEDLEIYQVIRKLIEDIDSHLSFLMFLSTLYNACTMYFGIDNLMRPVESCYKNDNAAVWLLFGTSYSAFIAMAVTGTLVHESSESILHILKELACKRCRLLPSQKHILFNDNNHISLTVWKIIPIRRSFIIGTLGTVLTYCMLFNGMESNAQEEFC